MQKLDSHTHLTNLLTKIKTQNINRTKEQIINIQGQIIQILKTMSFFRNQAEIYGIQVLMYYIPIIETYILRAGMQIIGDEDDYVIMEGVVKCMKSNGELGNIYTEGMLIDPSLQSNKSQPNQLTNTQQSPAKLLKISKSAPSSQSLQKSIQNLAKFMKDRQAKYRQFQRMMSQDKNVGSFDLCQLIVSSKFAVLGKCAVVHSFGDIVERVGFTVAGQIKVDNTVVHEKQKAVQPGKLVLQKYMIHKKQHNSSVISFVSPGQWIGLQQFLWKQKQYLSKAQVVSHDAQILFIPTQVFEKKFNQLTCFYLINKLKGLIQTKKRLLDKTIKTKKQKEMEIIQEKLKNDALQRMFQRMEKNDPKKTLSKFQTIVNNSGINNNNNNQNKKDLIRKRQKFMQSRFPKQCYMPQRLVHKVKVFQQKYLSLPKIQQRLVLFPQQYEKAMIPLDLREQLKFLQMMREKNNRKQDKNSFRFLSRQKVYETVIYASLSPKSQNPQKSLKKMTKTRSKASIQLAELLSKESGDQQFSQIGSGAFTSRTHFNKSIFNNFRAPKNKGQKLLKNISKTLQII